MQSHYITHQNSTVHYRIFGEGKGLIFCFHGYGREGDTFYVLEKRIGIQYTIVAIDVPYHGKTQWNDELVMRPEYLVLLVNNIRRKLFNDTRPFILLGFSMGGRIAMHLTMLMAENVRKLVLLAPDGLNYNFWRRIATHTWVGNKLLTYTINHPGWAMYVINKAEKWRVLPASMANFVRFYIEDKNHRLKLYNRYMSMRAFDPSLKKLKREIENYNIQVRLLFGKFDKIIPSAGGKNFMKGIAPFCKMYQIEAGHNLLNDVHAAKIVQLIEQ